MLSRSAFIRPYQAGDATSGTRLPRPYITQDVVRIVAPVMKALQETRNQQVAQAVRDLILIMAGLMGQFSAVGFDLSNLPAISGANLEDGSFLVEWLPPNCRVGFVIETEAKDSMWYLVTKQNSRDSNKSGSLGGIEGKSAVSQLVSFVVSHS